MKSLPNKQAPILRFLENISHWESSRDLFKNVAFVEDDKRQHTWLAIRVSTLKGISSIERKALFEGSIVGDSRFLGEESKDDYLKGRRGVLGTASHQRCIKLPVQNVPCDIKIRFEELLSKVDANLKLDEHLKTNLDLVYGVQSEDASADENSQPGSLEDVLTNTSAGSITSPSSQATLEPGTSNSLASSTGNLSQVNKRQIGTMPHGDEPVAKKAVIQKPNRLEDTQLSSFVKNYQHPWETVNAGIHGQKIYSSVSNVETKERETLNSLKGKHLSHMKTPEY